MVNYKVGTSSKGMSIFYSGKELKEHQTIEEIGIPNMAIVLFAASIEGGSL